MIFSPLDLYPFWIWSVWRLELEGAEGQLESMAAGNFIMVPLLAEAAQAQTDFVLHRRNFGEQDAAADGLPTEPVTRYFKAEGYCGYGFIAHPPPGPESIFNLGLQSWTSILNCNLELQS